MSKIVSLGIHVLDVLGRHVNRFPPVESSILLMKSA
ncbi:putative sugar kinase [Yersinia pseudotuberculosis]|uniref:Putative sugar kinase n=1 Tax=Yersinia pseudotuberculosis TaxID=633 RepID=A0A380Q7Q6_YERPU|nr:putative sugar kinase [Yersinia pseudotuberculosis]